MEYDIVIIGGGILGLSVSREILKRDKKIKLAIFEKEEFLSRHQTGRNSGVIHSGIYYDPESAKSEYCIEGGIQLKKYCKKNKMPLKKVGKMIIANHEDELEGLYFLKKRAEILNLKHKMIGIVECKEIEPLAHCIEALHLPDVCITDYSAIAESLKREVQSLGADFLFSCRVERVESDIEHSYIYTKNKKYISKNVINCAGVYADSFLRSLHKNKIRIIPFKGIYWKTTGLKVGVNLYPVPNLKFPFLGVHFTPTANGEVLIGPNAFLSLHKEGYGNFDFDLKDSLDIFSFPGFWNFSRKNFNTCLKELKNSSRNSIWKSAKLICPSLPLESIRYHSSGIRAQALTKEGKLCDDFVFVNDGNMLNVVNAPSPAATSSFEIAKHIVDKIDL